MRYTVEEIMILEDMLEHGKNTTEIAFVLGKTVQSAGDKIRYMKSTGELKYLEYVN